MVTANHVIEGIRAKSIDGEALVRINTTDGEGVFVPSKLDDWHGHPTDASVDVAVMAGLLPQDRPK